MASSINRWSLSFYAVSSKSRKYVSELLRAKFGAEWKFFWYSRSENELLFGRGIVYRNGARPIFHGYLYRKTKNGTEYIYAAYRFFGNDLHVDLAR